MGQVDIAAARSVRTRLLYPFVGISFCIKQERHTGCPNVKALASLVAERSYAGLGQG